MIHLNYRDARPIYEQIKDGMRKLVATGALRAGEKLPSVRDLATQLAINPNTIQRAYRDLEKEGYLYTEAGRGTFVAERENIYDDRQKELLTQFDELVTELLYLTVPKETLHERIETIGEGSGKV